ncbi:Gfo/Idh/MocA family oxidoreductase [Streptosporangium sp. NPDC001559]|uniref:Gfo/Idh/MocA family oxidoreductase n=1 Tax=Streptosporangium sp. NPDC001559 TaxID=3366187 RepID=UPI0036E18EDD
MTTEFTSTQAPRRGRGRTDRRRSGTRHLAEHPEVDLVVITVRVPAHAELVEAALAAGKHVYCEWPLARTTDEADTLTKSAHSTGVHHAVGLQARCAPAI